MFVYFPTNKLYVAKKIEHSNQEVGWLTSTTSNKHALVKFL